MAWYSCQKFRRHFSLCFGVCSTHVVTHSFKPASIRRLRGLAKWLSKKGKSAK